MMPELRTQKAILSDIHELIQELIHVEDSEDKNNFLLTGFIIAGTGVNSSDVHNFRAAYYQSSELNPIMAAGIADYAYSRSREAISKRVFDGQGD